MGLETEPGDGTARMNAPLWLRGLTALWRWLWQPVDFWRAMEVLGLWTAAAVAVIAIQSSTRDANEQVTEMGRQLDVMSGQLKEMQAEGRAWVGPVGAHLVNRNPDEPLKIALLYRNFGRQPATFVRNKTGAAIFVMPARVGIEHLPGWNDPKLFQPRSLCEVESPHMTVYPTDTTYSAEGGVSKQNPAKDGNGHETPVSTVVNEIVGQTGLYVFLDASRMSRPGNPSSRRFVLC